LVGYQKGGFLLTFWEILLIGVALSMDAFAVSAVSGMSIKNIRRSEILLLACAFGGFQGIMPLLGFYAGSIFTGVMSVWAPYIACLLLIFVGGKMIWDTMREEAEALTRITLKIVLVQAVATSIDALAVGVSFAAASYTNIWSAAGIIACTTFLLTIAAVQFGRVCGSLLAEKAGIVGGIILIIIGLKQLF
jgi:putative Mn2+ efflux pump MntP